MGKGLHKLGVYMFKRPWHAIGGWLLALVLLGMSAAYFMQPTTSSISIPGTEAQKAIDRADELFPDAGKGSGRVVFAAPDGKKISGYKQQIQEFVAESSKVDGVETVINPFDNPMAISKDGSIAFVQVQLENETGAVAVETIGGVSDAVKNARDQQLTVEMGGDLVDQAPGEILGIGEIAGVLIALLVLVMTLGSLIAAGMPIATAIIAVGVSTAALFSMSHLIEIGATTPVLGVMLGLAVGIDYSLFIINKYRTYLLDGYEPEVAIGRAIGTAGNAVVFAAATVVIALSALAIVQVPFMTTMGLAGAATIATAALVAITLIPALLRLAGDKVFGRKARKAIAVEAKKGPHSETVNRRTIWYKWGKAITRYPVAVVLLAVVVVGTVALPAHDLKLGLPTDEYAAKESSERKAYDLMAKGFGVGFNSPLVVVAENLPAVTDADRQTVRAEMQRQYEAQVAKATVQQQAVFQQRAAAITTPEEYAALMQEVALLQQQGEVKKAEAQAQIEENVEQYAKLVQLKKVADEIAKHDTVDTAVPAIATDDGSAGIIQVIPTTAPSDQKTIDLIAYLRDTSHQKELTGGKTVELTVTGARALQLDIDTKLANALPQYLAVVVGLSLVLLIIAFRSVLVPIKATLGFLLSVLAMFGAIVAVFQWGWFGIAEAPGPLVSFIPIIAIGILFGLAMDYEFFIMSGIHEAHAKGKEPRQAVIDGFALGSRVVTAAAVIMVAVFAGFITNHEITVQAIGFGLAVGIFIDAFIIRMTMVPAVMVLLGNAAWWLPKWLDKLLPHVSIEGEAGDKKK